MSTEPGDGPPHDLPRRVAGYRVLRELGRGSLGTLVLARQAANGREVALRVVRPEWACLPKYVARLTRDAYAAAAIRHPNLARLLDFDEGQGRVIFAGERVDGASLADRRGALKPREAVAIALQAARGLQHAHRQGLTHGRVTPKSVFVTADGLIKVTDLGLTLTPAALADEEARASAPLPLGTTAEADAWAEAVRDDLRGLGRTLAQALNGRAETDPTALIASGLPANVVEVVRNLADRKSPGAFGDMGQAVAALERLLGGRSAEAGTPRPEDVGRLAASASAFQESPAARVRSQAVWGGVAALLGFVLLALLLRRPTAAVSFLGLGVMTAVAYLVLDGRARGSERLGEIRALLVGGRGTDRLVGAAAFVLLAAGLVVLRLHWAWLLFGLLALLIAGALQRWLDPRAEAERKAAVDDARGVVKSLRLQGVGEDAVRRLVRSSSAPVWEPFFGAVFGEDAVRAARERGDRGVRAWVRNRAVPWRDGLSAWVEARLDDRRAERDRAHLQAVEERGLVAGGVNLLTARRKARRIAEAMVAVAAEARASARGGDPDPGHGPTLARVVREAAETPESALVEREHGLIGGEAPRVLGLLTGPRTRFLLGALLLAGFLAWVHQNEVISAGQIREAAAKAVNAPDRLAALRETRIDVRLPPKTTPLRLPFLPGPVARWFGGFPAGASGLILVVSSLFAGSRVGWFAAPGAAVALFGPSLGMPRVGPLDPASASTAAGAGLAALGLLFGRAGGERI